MRSKSFTRVILFSEPGLLKATPFSCYYRAVTSKHPFKYYVEFKTVVTTEHGWT